MTQPRIPEGLAYVLGVDEQEIITTLDDQGWTEQITMEHLAQWAETDIPDEVMNACGDLIVPVSILVSLGLDMDYISEVVDKEGGDLPDFSEFPGEDDDVDWEEVNRNADNIIAEVKHDVESGRAESPKIYSIGTMLFKDIGDDKIDLLNFFPAYPDNDDLGKYHIEGAEHYFAVRDGFQPEDRVMLPVENSFMTTLAREVDHTATEYLVTLLFDFTPEGNATVCQFGLEIDDDYATYDAAYMALLAEKKFLIGANIVISVLSLNGQNQSGSWWSDIDGILHGVAQEESRGIRDIPVLGEDTSTPVVTYDHSLLSLPDDVRLLPAREE